VARCVRDGGACLLPSWAPTVCTRLARLPAPLATRACGGVRCAGGVSTSSCFADAWLSNAVMLQAFASAKARERRFVSQRGERAYAHLDVPLALGGRHKALAAAGFFVAKCGQAGRAHACLPPYLDY